MAARHARDKEAGHHGAAAPCTHAHVVACTTRQAPPARACTCTQLGRAWPHGRAWPQRLRTGAQGTVRSSAVGWEAPPCAISFAALRARARGRHQQGQQQPSHASCAADPGPQPAHGARRRATHRRAAPGRARGPLTFSAHTHGAPCTSLLRCCCLCGRPRRRSPPSFDSRPRPPSSLRCLTAPPRPLLTPRTQEDWLAPRAGAVVHDMVRRQLEARACAPPRTQL